MSDSAKTLLVIEDNRFFLGVLGRLLGASLSETRVRLVTAATGEEGVEAALRHRPIVALVDLWLPGMHGLDVIRRLRREHPRMYIIAISADAESYLGQAIDAGADRFIPKSMIYVELPSALRSITQLPPRSTDPGVVSA